MGERGLKEFVAALLRRRALILLCAIAGLLVAIGINTFSKPKFAASATVRIALSSNRASVFEDRVSLPTTVIDPVQSQIELIKSQDLIQRAVESSGLFVFTKTRGLRLTRVKARGQKLATGSYTLQLDHDSYVIALNGRAIATGYKAKPVNARGLEMSVDWDDSAPKKAKIEVQDPVLTARAMAPRFKVVQKGKTDLVRISFTDNDPELAAAAVNALADAYVEYTMTQARQQAHNARKFIEDQLQTVSEELQAAEDSLRAFKEANGVFQLDESGKQTIQQLSGLDAALSQALTEANAFQRQINALEQQLNDTSTAFARYKTLSMDPALSSNSQLSAMNARMNQLAQKRANLLTQLSPSHPEIIAIDSEMQELRQDMARTASQVLELGPGSGDQVVQQIYTQLIQAQVGLASARATASALRGIIAEKEGLLSTYPRKEQKLAELQRRVQANRRVYDVLIERLQEAKIEEARQVSQAAVVDRAEVPASPVWPRKKMNILLGLLMGLMVGLVSVYIMELADASVRSPEDIDSIIARTKAPGVVSLGAVPLVNSKQEKDEDQPYSLLKDASYTLAMNLLYYSRQNKRVFVFTSANPQEGKTFTITRVARALAEMGKKVLLVDGDMRRPRVHKVFEIQSSPGLADILLGKTDLRSALVQVKPGLWVLPAGKVKGFSASLFASGAFRQMVSGMPGEFDVVLFDSPPLGIGAVDTLEMVSIVPWSVLVVRHFSTDRNCLKDAIKQLLARKGNLFGFVMNGVRLSPGYYSGSGYAYYRKYHRVYRPKNFIRRVLFWTGFTNR